VARLPALTAAPAAATAEPLVSIPEQEYAALQALAAAYLAVREALFGPPASLVAPRVAPTFDTPGDGPGQAGTAKPKRSRKAE
jgi:hypothetical protein